METSENILDIDTNRYTDTNGDTDTNRDKEYMKLGITYTTKNMIRYYKSNSPIIISCGHGGAKKPVNVNARTCKGAPTHCDCKILSDLNTIEITERVVKTLTTMTAPVIPSVVIADFHRKYIDINRSQECAYEDQDGKLYYDLFHKELREFVSNIKPRYPVALLFDIHGTAGRGADNSDVYIGTRNGNVDPSNSSIKNLLKIDPSALSKLRQLFKNKGYAVQPSHSGDEEAYKGDYVIKAYGSNNHDGIDCIQFEIDDRIRDDYAKRIKFADNLASIMKTFTHLFLPKT